MSNRADLLAAILPMIEEILRRSHSPSRDPRTKTDGFEFQFAAIKKFNDNDSIAALGAVASAVEEFDSSTRPKDLGALDPELACKQIVRIAYNRMQRMLRQQRKIQSALASGVFPNGDDLLSTVEFKKISVLSEQMREVIDITVEAMPSNEQNVIQRRFEGQTQSIIAEELGVSRASVQRIEKRFSDAVRKLEQLE